MLTCTYEACRASEYVSSVLMGFAQLFRVSALKTGLTVHDGVSWSWSTGSITRPLRKRTLAWIPAFAGMTVGGGRVRIPSLQFALAAPWIPGTSPRMTLVNAVVPLG